MATPAATPELQPPLTDDQWDNAVETFFAGDDTWSEDDRQLIVQGIIAEREADYANEIYESDYDYGEHLNLTEEDIDEWDVIEAEESDRYDGTLAPYRFFGHWGRYYGGHYGAGPGQPLYLSATDTEDTIHIKFLSWYSQHCAYGIREHLPTCTCRLLQVVVLGDSHNDGSQRCDLRALARWQRRVAAYTRVFSVMVRVRSSAVFGLCDLPTVAKIAFFDCPHLHYLWCDQSPWQSLRVLLCQHCPMLTSVAEPGVNVASLAQVAPRLVSLTAIGCPILDLGPAVFSEPMPMLRLLTVAKHTGTNNTGCEQMFTPALCASPRLQHITLTGVTELDVVAAIPDDLFVNAAMRGVLHGAKYHDPDVAPVDHPFLSFKNDAAVTSLVQHEGIPLPRYNHAHDEAAAAAMTNRMQTTDNVWVRKATHAILVMADRRARRRNPSHRILPPEIHNKIREDYDLFPGPNANARVCVG